MNNQMLQFFVRVAALALLCALSGPASAIPYFVATNGNDTTGDGLTWATAWLTISNAVAQTTNGDTVTVSNGTYNTAAQISITNAITVRSVNGASNTVVNRSAVGSAAPQHRIFYVNNAGAVVDGFTIRNGYDSSGYGGGVYMNGGIVSNCSIIKNYSSAYGGGVYIASGTVVDSTITSNTTLYLGGAYVRSRRAGWSGTA